MPTLHHQLNRLNNKLGGSISRLDGDRILQYHNQKGIGQIISVALEAGISYTEYNMDLNENLKMNLDNRTGSALYFLYCLKGNFAYSWASDANRKNEILELQTVILGSNKSSLNVFIPKEKKVSFALIKVEKSNRYRASLDDYALNQKLFHQFLTLTKEDPFEYRCTFNLKIKEQLVQIRNIRQSGVVRKLLIKGIIHFALALELMQHQQDKVRNESIKTRLTKKELLRVKETIDAISKNPQHSYPISILCRNYALSAAKLQEGFKVLEGCTVGNYIKRMRVEMAERLIKKGDLNISEVVYSVGFTSRSYFSKIFRNRYACTPKYYQEHCKNLASA